MNELYWITRLDAVNTVVGLSFIISLIGGIGLALGYLFSGDRGESLNKLKRCLKIISTSFAISVILFIFIPSQKEALIIYGIGGTIDYIKSNSTAQQLPDKCVQALDKLIDSYLKDDNYEQIEK